MCNTQNSNSFYINVVHSLTDWSLSAAMISITTYNVWLRWGLVSVQGLDCYILQDLEMLSYKILKCYCDKLMLGCEEKNLERVLPSTKLFSSKATERLFNLLEHLSTHSDCLWSGVFGLKDALVLCVYLIASCQLTCDSFYCSNIA